MEKIRNLILTFLLMFVGLVSASALTNEEMEYIEEKFGNLRLYSTRFQNDEEQFYYFEEASNPNINLIEDYITGMFDYTQYILNIDEDYNSTGETIKFQVPKDVFEKDLEETFVVNDEFYTELHNNFRPTIGNESSAYKEIDGSYYYYYESHYGMGIIPYVQPLVKGYKDLGNNQYQVYFYDVIKKEYADDSDLMNENNVYITRKNYADEDTEYLVLGYLTSKIEYKNSNVKYLSYEEVEEKNIPRDLVLYEESKNEILNDKKDTLWNEFVEKYEKDLLEGYEDLDAEIEVTSTDKSLSIVFTGKGEDEEDNYTLTTNFSYENGILEYDSSWVNKVNEETIFIQAFWDSILIILTEETLYDIKGYDKEKLKKWLLSKETEDLTLEKDGIESVEETYNYTGEGVNLTAPIFTTFKLDIVNGLKSYNEELISNYEFISGENQKYKVNETKELKFEIDGEYSKFEKVYINDNLLDSSNYTASEGSTIIVLKKEYLDTLNNGEYTVKVTFSDDGFVETKFTVEKTVKNPTTGIDSGYKLLILVVAVCVVGYFLIRKQSKFPKHS